MRYLVAMQVVPRAPWRHPWPGNSPFANATGLPMAGRGRLVLQSSVACALSLLADSSRFLPGGQRCRGCGIALKPTCASRCCRADEDPFPLMR